MKNLILFLILFTIVLPITAQKKQKSDYLFTLTTEYGQMKFLLYDQTPKHKDNFLKLVEEGFYDSTTFHRIIDGFMIQGGDPYSKDDNPSNDGTGGPGYRVDAEFVDGLYHKKGAIAAARQGDRANPLKQSSGSQFYIVMGKVIPEAQLERNTQLSDQAKEDYATIGGTPHLDGNYTVFGEVIEGLDIIDIIAAQKKDRRDRPVENIYMTIEVEKMKRKKITKKLGYEYPELPE